MFERAGSADRSLARRMFCRGALSVLRLHSMAAQLGFARHSDARFVPGCSLGLRAPGIPTARESIG